MVVLALSLLVGLGACASPQVADTATSSTTSSPSSAPPAESATTTRPSAERDLESLEWDVERVATLEDRLLSWLGAPPGRDELWVADSHGELLAVDDGAVTEVVLDIRSEVSTEGEQGLLGVAFSPSFASEAMFYVSYTDAGGHNVVREYVVDESGLPVDPDSGRQVLFIEEPENSPVHNIGALVFGPDGALYVGVGDGGPAGDPRGNGQDITNLKGSILRIDVTGDGFPDDPDRNYRIPADNPDSDGALEVWAYGLRNPWRFWIDEADRLMYIADVGEGAVEEIQVVPLDPATPYNFGWSILEGSECFKSDECDSSGTVLPTFEYRHDDIEGECAAAVGGATVRDEETVPEAIYLFAEFCTGHLFGIQVVDGRLRDDHQWDLDLAYPVAFAYGPDEQVWVAERHGGLVKLEPTDWK